MKIPMNNENFAWSITHNKLSKNSNNKLEPWTNYDTSYLETISTRNGLEKQDYKGKKWPKGLKKQD
jgi:hypothetical protein